MGKKPDDIAGEIRDLRDETAIIVDELANRATPGYVAREVRSTVSARASETVDTARETAGTAVHRAGDIADSVTQSMPEPVRSTVQNNPSIAGGAMLGLLASLGVFAVANVVESRRHSPSELAAMRLRSSANRLNDTMQATLQSSILPPLRNAVSAANQQLNTGANVRVSVERSQPSMVKRLVWVGLVSVMGALGAMLFQRFSAVAWKRTMHEEPPKK